MRWVDDHMADSLDSGIDAKTSVHISMDVVQLVVCSPQFRSIVGICC